MPNSVNTNIDATVRAVDIVNKFGRDVENLMKLLEISEPIEKAAGTKLVSYKTSVVLKAQQSAGAEIEYSEVNLEEVNAADLAIKPYRKGVTLQDLEKYGATVAVNKTDEAFLNAIENDVTTSIFGALADGTLTGAYSGFQMALAMAKALVIDKATELQKNASGVVGFVNVLDFYGYLGNQQITVQTAFGMNYVENFLGYRTIFLLGSNIVAPGKIYATAIENLDIYYVNPASADVKKLGLNFNVDEDRPFLGVAVDGNYSTMVGDVYGVAAVKLWLTYLDMVANVDIDSNF